MKIGDRLFPFPVLSEQRTDYEGARFSAVGGIGKKTLDQVVLDFDLNLDCRAIAELVARAEATYAVHVECPSTFYRELVHKNVPHFTHRIDLDRLRGSVERTALVVATRRIEGFASDLFAEDFAGLSFTIPRGAILAYASLPIMTVNQPSLLADEGHSVFTVYKRPETGDVPMSVDVGRDSICIGLGAAEYDNYVRMSGDAAMRPMLNSLLVLPALVYALEQLRDEEVLENSRGLEWFETLSRSLRTTGRDLEEVLRGEEDGAETIELAQELMRSPIQAAFGALIQLDSEDGGEEG